MVGDSSASGTTVDEAVTAEGQQHPHRELAAGWTGLRDRLQHNDLHAAKMARMGDKCRSISRAVRRDCSQAAQSGLGLHRRGSGSSSRDWDTW